ncbi:pyruvate dehydrogenase E1 component alpha subunit mitochondrial precursor [Penicillium maclennaniae]|uniref:pyruvate dehydrogenase E1 component alpha subunit mitochondrial precursor n=1 Tax=Penicillium maclennaniae TaxID=1343394 RepID=UPI00253FCE76|nr:pyruvate dehydrogenase E1 component alpha subunit mitochondrial precursor [Penicillium maclennaniae]KAJ5662091.1 pyruvate dehydrogenase E1 component alpha subunit mitochondrial precursor [Penicillium maclennaniae]
MRPYNCPLPPLRSRFLRLHALPGPLHASTRSFAQVAHRPVLDVPSEDDKPFMVPIADASFETYHFDPPPYSRRELVKIKLMRAQTDGTRRRWVVQGKKDSWILPLVDGQEAVAVGIEHALTKEDKRITAYRSHGNTLMRGATIRSIIGELLGRSDGIAHGKGGSMHMYAKSFFGGNGIVGSSVPLGTGIALAQQYDNTGNITVNLYGDGAANQGQVHEAFNMAKLWSLPVMFGCENNKFGMGTSVERASASTEYYKRGQYISGLKVDGMDVLAVLAAVRHGREWIKAGNGPLIYEYETYRYSGHSMSDPGTAYRSREELQDERSNDPITSLKSKLIDWHIMTEDEAKAEEKEIRGLVSREIQAAEQMPEPEPRWDVLFEDIYVSGSEPAQRRGRSIDETIY